MTRRAESASQPGAGPITSAIVVNWNGVPHLRECLQSLEQQSRRDQMEIIVVDNGSADASRQIIDEFPDVRLLQNDSNLGFAGACNQAIAVSRGQYLALLNNDAAADPQWIERLVEAMQRHQAAGLCTSKVLSHFNRRQIDNTGHVIFADGLARGRGRMETDRGQYDREEEVFSGSGCALLIRRALIEDIGDFDGAFFMYCEDTDLAMRARLRGWTCVYVPGAIVYHRFSASTDSFSPMKAFLVERNRIWCVLKNYPASLLPAVPFRSLARYAWQAVGAVTGRGASGLFARRRSRLRLAWILVTAYASALAGLPRVLRQRRAIQRRRTTSAAQFRSDLKRYGVGAREIAFLE